MELPVVDANRLIDKLKIEIGSLTVELCAKDLQLEELQTQLVELEKKHTEEQTA